ncbi:MAG TPA: DNA topoisomerase 4 subunit A, partial [Vicinamibacterales bacterium]|nr:DNA topoisomerase 4 subunit A [Vicinamibacterales bacterium]
DVRDGLKPVQRRILYTMWQQNLTAGAKHRKCAKVVGDVMGNYHPHGDTAIYDTLVRMAQPFSLRYPLVDGSGNFGSLDGDAAAAMRYTECRLARLSDEVLQEIEQETVHFRPNYDGTRQEPVVLPSRIPNLLANGATGIAVGMATNIPPHNLHEVCTALVKLLDDPDLSSVQLCRWVKGPDFPTGGHVLNSPTELKEIYRTGSGSIRIRGTWEPGAASRGSKMVYITSVPYGVNKAQLVEQIGDVVLGRKMPHLVDVKDLSTDDVRIELELKGSADENLVMAYLFKHTPLQTSFAVNLTCLVPTENPEVGRPERLDLKQMLWHFLHFRLDVVTSRLEHELAQLERRIHILEGFEKVFDALDEIIRIIRKSDGKADAADKIVKRFELDADQADAILELKLYRLARLEILVIQNELGDKRKRARQITALLDDDAERWTLVREEIADIQKKYGDPRGNPRRTRIEEAEEVEYSAESFIVDEDNVVIVSRDGWVKRQKEVRDLATTRLREGDGVLAAAAGSTRATVVFFSNFGTAYTARIVDVPASTGYGEPVQKLFKFKDGERVIAAFSLDPRVRGDIGHVPDAGTEVPALQVHSGDAARSAGAGVRSAGASAPADADADADAPPVHALAVTSDGYSLRFSLAGFVEPSTRAGRRYARVPEGAEVVAVGRTTGEEVVIAATRDARAMLCRIDEVNFLSGPGRGVILIKLQDDDRVIGAMVSSGDRNLMTVETTRGSEQTVSTAKYDVTGRGGKGRELMQRGGFTRVVPGEVPLPVLPEGE